MNIQKIGCCTPSRNRQVSFGNLSDAEQADLQTIKNNTTGIKTTGIETYNTLAALYDMVRDYFKLQLAKSGNCSEEEQYKFTQNHKPIKTYKANEASSGPFL